jgi:hypothetical protein
LNNAKTISAAAMKRIRKTGRPRKRWREEIEDNLNIIGIKTGNQ